MPQLGFLDLDERYTKPDEPYPLVKLNQLINWEAFRKPLPVIRQPLYKSKASRKPCYLVLIFKIVKWAMEMTANQGIELPLFALTAETYLTVDRRYGFESNHLKVCVVLNGPTELFYVARMRQRITTIDL